MKMMHPLLDRLDDHLVLPLDAVELGSGALAELRLVSHEGQKRDPGAVRAKGPHHVDRSALTGHRKDLAEEFVAQMDVRGLKRSSDGRIAGKSPRFLAINRTPRLPDTRKPKSEAVLRAR